MHFLFISSTFPDAAHPARGTYNGALCRALARRHTVTAIAPRPWMHVLRSGKRNECSAPAFASDAGIACHFPTFWYTPGLLHAQHGRCMWQPVRAVVAAIHAELPVDGVVSYWTHPDGEAGLRAARFARVPHAVIVGGSDVLLLPRSGRRRAATLFVLRESDAVITISEGLREAVVDLGIAPDRVHTVYQGIDPELFRRGDREAARRKLGLSLQGNLLLWVGRMVPVKALDVLIEAARSLKERGRVFELVLAGDGPLRPQIEQCARRLGLSDRVRCIGAVPPEQLPDWYRAANVTVLSSRSEGLPNVLRESLACGTPFVSTDVGSVREIAEPAWSRLVPPGRPDALADAIESLLVAGPSCRKPDWPVRTWDDCAAEVAELFQHQHHVQPVAPTALAAFTH